MPNTLPPMLEEYIEAALWALKSDRSDVAKTYLLQAIDEDGQTVTVSVNADTLNVEVD